MKRRLAALVLIALGLAAWFAGRQQALRLASGWDQQVYVWQRVWTPQHADALASSRDLFTKLRVLALQVHPREGWREIPADLSLLKQDGRPLWLVARLDGQLPQLDQEAIIQRLLALTQRWQAAGLPVTGIEIDHDAATARLPDYQRFLQRLRQRLPAALQLGITALPAWIGSPNLPGVLQQADSSVLQVHAVLSPQQGLFDGPLALRWVRQYAAVTPKPFRVALPAYGMAGFWAVSCAPGRRFSANAGAANAAPAARHSLVPLAAGGRSARLVARHAASSDRTAAAERRLASKI